MELENLCWANLLIGFRFALSYTCLLTCHCSHNRGNGIAIGGTRASAGACITPRIQRCKVRADKSHEQRTWAMEGRHLPRACLMSSSRAPMWKNTAPRPKPTACSMAYCCRQDTHAHALILTPELHVHRLANHRITETCAWLVGLQSHCWLLLTGAVQ